MKKRLDLCLLLSCSGSNINNFVICSGTENIILDFKNMSEEKYESILNFLDNACGLFDTIINDYNKLVNVITLLYRNYDAFDSKKLELIQFYLKMHKNCGMYISLILREDL